ncbi:MAG TPA: D-alanyl-D-alanine carboxypeptidase family protein [Solirubrobacteraceae bacterium]|nr:D-alanyl-D-alanine carboxypeptidase family protein [Solirubrobacteraceae bacterium]
MRHRLATTVARSITRATAIGACAAAVGACAAAVGACAAAIAAPAAMAATPPGPPPLPVRAAALLEESTGQQLLGENANAELPIASTTKLMTALVTLRHARLSEVFADPDYYPASEDSQIGLVPGERMSVHDLLIAMLLPSADDAAEDLAYNVGHGSVGRFLGMMNARARELGLAQTHYTTPSGLDTPGNYSSAHDLVLLARYDLLTEPFFRAVVDMRSAVLRTGNHVRVVTNLNDLLDRYSWINGVKTGHTLGAGYVLVASGTQHGMTLIDAVLGTPSEAARDDSALALLNWGFANFTLRTPVRVGQLIARAAVTGGTPGQTVRLLAAATDTHVFPKGVRINLRVHAPAALTGPLPANDTVGWVTVRDGGQVQARIPLRLGSALPAIKHSTALDSVFVLSATLSGLVLAAGAAIGLTMFWREWSRG